MHTAAVATGADVAAVGTDSYAMGWGVGEVDGHRLLAHDGDTIGYHANVVLLPAERSGLVVLAARNGALTAANGPATAGTAVLVGEPRREPLHDVRTTYVVVDALALLLLFWLTGLLLRRSWRDRVAARVQQRGPWRAAFLPVMVNLMIAALVDVGVFQGLATITVGFPVSLRFAFGFVGPDVTVLVLITSAVFVARAAIAVLVVKRATKTF